MKYYDNPSCTGLDEFNEDLGCITNVKRILKKYKKDGKIKIRLVLNHLITFYNVFNSTAATRMLVLQLKDYIPQLKSLLLFLNFWPEKVCNINGKTIYDCDVLPDSNILNMLNEEFK